MRRHFVGEPRELRRKLSRSVDKGFDDDVFDTSVAVLRERLIDAAPGRSVEAVAEDARAWVRSLFLDHAKEAGARDPERLAQQLVLLYNGAGISAWMAPHM